MGISIKNEHVHSRRYSLHVTYLQKSSAQMLAQATAGAEVHAITADAMWRVHSAAVSALVEHTAGLYHGSCQ